jgi:hypothetical protein
LTSTAPITFFGGPFESGLLSFRRRVEVTKSITMHLSEIGLKSKPAALKEAKAIATHHLGVKVLSASPCVLQGMFSRTIDVTMKDGTKHVVQLRSESVHEENA